MQPHSGWRMVAQQREVLTRQKQRLPGGQPIPMFRIEHRDSIRQRVFAAGRRMSQSKAARKIEQMPGEPSKHAVIVTAVQCTPGASSSKPVIPRVIGNLVASGTQYCACWTGSG